MAKTFSEKSFQMLSDRIEYVGKNRFPPLSFKSKSFFDIQADRGFARSRLCTDEDGTTNNVVLYMVRNVHKKGGGRSAGYGIKEVF